MTTPILAKLAPVSSVIRYTARAAAKVDLAQITLLEGLRTAGLIAGLIAIGIATGRLVEGVSVASGALLAAFADPGGPARLKGPVMIVAAAGGAIAGFAAMCVGASGLAVAPTAALGFGSGLLLAAGRASAVGVLSTIGFIVAANYPVPVSAALQHSAFTLAGGAIQIAISVAFSDGAGRAARAALAEACQALAEEVSGPRAPKFRAAAAGAEEIVGALSGAPEPPALLRAARSALDELERLSLELVSTAALRTHVVDDAGAQADLTLVLNGTAAVLRACAAALEQSAHPTAATEPMLQARAASERLLRDAEPGSAAAALAGRTDAIRGQLRALLDVVSAISGERLGGSVALARAYVPQPRDAIEAVRANVTPSSPVFRHAIRLAVMLAVGTAIARTSSLGRGYWIPMTILLVLRPDFGQTFTRGLQRSAGTAVGVTIATLLARLLHPGLYGLAALVFLCAAPAFGIRKANYALFSVAMSATIVFLTAFEGIPESHVAFDRLVDVLIGSALAMLAYLAWPTYERNRTDEAVAALIDADRRYAAEVLRATASGAALDPERVGRIRLTARRRRTAAQASLARARAEPARARIDPARAEGMLAATWRLATSVVALEAHVRNASTERADPHAAELADAVDDSLKAIADYVAAGAETPPLPPSPPLRHLHDQLAASSDGFIVEALDRLVDAVDTLGYLASTAQAM
jgi:uncharacterized membrane protein YccC